MEGAHDVSQNTVMSSRTLHDEYIQNIDQREQRRQNTGSFLQHHCNLDVEAIPTTVRLTGIICTIGPSCRDVPTLKTLVASGMNIARLNFSHGTHDYHQESINNVLEAARDELPHTVAIALDTKGPEIRTGILKDNKEVSLKKGNRLVLTTDPAYSTCGDEHRIFLAYSKLAESVKLGGLIYISDGLLALLVEKITGGDVECKILNDAVIGSQKNCTLPGAVVDLPTLGEKDLEDLKFGVKNNVDMIFASFIRRATDVTHIRDVLGKEGAGILIISKIENHEGIRNIDEIIRVSDGIMVARGDMGMDIPLEKVFIAQKMIIAKCNQAGKPVICATQMLESMIQNPRPTRAEVADVSNAVLDGADCVMLSGETAKGLYPVESVIFMHKICREAEVVIYHKMVYEDLKNEVDFCDSAEATAIAAVSASFKVNASAIILLTTTGKSCYQISHFRPRCPIIMVTRTEKVARQAQLYHGIFPLVYTKARPSAHQHWEEDIDARLDFAIKHGREAGFLRTGSHVVFVSGWKPGPHSTNTMRILSITESKFQGYVPL